MDVLLVVGRITVLLGFALVLAFCWRRRSAAARHQLWGGLFAGLLVLPLLTRLGPVIDLPIMPAPPFTTIADVPMPGGPREDRRASAEAMQESSPAATPGPRHGAAAATGDWTWPSVADVVPLVWGTGTLAALSTLILSLMRVARLRRSGDLVDDPAWQEAASVIAARLHLRRPPGLVVHSSVTTPMAGGIWRPCVFLPPSSRDWSEAEREVVLMHELVHLARRDPLGHVLMRAALALYWFHPLAWLAARLAAAAREQACDEAVVALGTRPSEYARVLVDLAGDTRVAGLSAALPMARRSELETRVMHILKPSRRSVAGRTAFPLGLIAIATCLVAVVRVSAAVTPNPSISLHHEPVAVAAAPPEAPLARPVVTPAAARTTVLAQSTSLRDSACRWDWRRSDFHGSMNTTGGEVLEAIGRRGADRIVTRTFGDVRLCLVAEDVGDRDTASAKPSDWMEIAPRTVLEAQRGRDVQRLEIVRRGGGTARTTWITNGVERPVDRAVEEWRDRFLALADATWELSMLRGQVSSLQGEISSIHGHRSSLQGRISSLQGQVSSMQGQISSIQGQVSSYHGQISSIQGHVSSLRGQISSEQGAISSLTAARYSLSTADRVALDRRIREREDAIARIEKEIQTYDSRKRIADVEKAIDAFDADQKISRIQADIRDFNLAGKVADVQKQIRDLDVEGKVRNLEGRIRDVRLEERTPGLQRRIDDALERFRQALNSIR